MAKGNSAFAPANGSSREDVADAGCYHIPADEPNLVPGRRDRKPFGGKPGDLSEAPEGGWEKQGHMVQPLPDGFSLPSLSTANIRRDEFELSHTDNFDPKEAMPPRIKKIPHSS